jgi:hypothetical protein
VILGPWLGAEKERATELGQRLGVPVGEALSGTSGTAGLRFESARARFAKAEIVKARAVRVEEDGSALRVILAGERPSMRARRVVIATGGLIGGGIGFAPPTHRAGWDGADAVKPAFRSTLEAPNLAPMKLAGSMHGPPLDETAWPSATEPGALESIGLALATSGAAESSVVIVGEARRGAPRTMIAAIASGLAAFTDSERAPMFADIELVSATTAR